MGEVSCDRNSFRPDLGVESNLILSYNPDISRSFYYVVPSIRNCSVIRKDSSSKYRLGTPAEYLSGFLAFAAPRTPR